eukprot:348804_1
MDPSLSPLSTLPTLLPPPTETSEDFSSLSLVLAPSLPSSFSLPLLLRKIKHTLKNVVAMHPLHTSSIKTCVDSNGYGWTCEGTEGFHDSKNDNPSWQTLAAPVDMILQKWGISRKAISRERI